MALVRKIQPKSNISTASKQHIIKVNPYENPDNVMELMARICSAQESASTNVFWESVQAGYQIKRNGTSLVEFLKKRRHDLFDIDFKNKLDNFCHELSWALSQKQNTNDIKIVVAGGFSSGKSSFLNQLTGSKRLLPTGVEPVSVVKTYLYCSDQARQVNVSGVNQKNVLVNLDTSVLQAIQHANKSNIYLASVLDKLFVTIPSSRLNGLVFIDTPGYNNSDKANQSNGKTDRETAEEALSEGNILFWLIDSERGTIPNSDILTIKGKFDGKIVFIFNKADKKGERESKRIVDEAAETLTRNGFQENDIIDIIAYSSVDNRIYYSKNHMTLDAIILAAKKSCSGNSEINSIRTNIEDLFDLELMDSKDRKKELEEELKECIDKKDEAYKYWQAHKNDNEKFLDDIKDVLISNYSEVLNVAQKYQRLANQCKDGWSDLIDSVQEYNRNKFFESEDLNKEIGISIDRYNSLVNQEYNNRYYVEEYRKNAYEFIAWKLEGFNSVSESRYKELSDSHKQLQQKLNNKKSFYEAFDGYKSVFMRAVDNGINAYRKQNKAINVSSNAETYNIYDCIKNDNYKKFLHCFENGVDLNVCNPDGYNPLTYAIMIGNNMMVQFMLDHDADPSIKDRRGYNALHTAVENEYRDICKMLLDNDPDLIDSKTNKGESAEDLVNKHTFSKWLTKEIDNAC